MPPHSRIATGRRHRSRRGAPLARRARRADPRSRLGAASVGKHGNVATPCAGRGAAEPGACCHRQAPAAGLGVVTLHICSTGCAFGHLAERRRAGRGVRPSTSRIEPLRQDCPHAGDTIHERVALDARVGAILARERGRARAAERRPRRRTWATVGISASVDESIGASLGASVEPGGSFLRADSSVLEARVGVGSLAGIRDVTAADQAHEKRRCLEDAAHGRRDTMGVR